MGAEQSKPGPLVQAALTLKGSTLVSVHPADFTHTPRLPGK